MKKIKENKGIIIIVLVILGIITLFHFLVFTSNTKEDSMLQDKKTISPVQYRKLDDECKKYGHENWGPTVDHTEEYRVYREYEYSILLNTCVMETEHYFPKNAQHEIGLRDIYLDKRILLFNSECEGNYRYIYEGIFSDEEISENIIEKCPTRDDILNKKIEIFEK